MRTGPIVSSLLRHKVSAGLVAAQIALTLAIIANALFVVVDRTTMINRPSGVAEADVFSVGLSPIGTPEESHAILLADLDLVRGLPGVANAYLANSMPLSGGGWSTGVTTGVEEQRNRDRMSAIYMVDENGIDTLGLTLVAGRNFEASEVLWHTRIDRLDPDSVIITAALAKRLFPDSDAVGKMIGISGTEGEIKQRVIGVVDRVVTPWAGWGQHEHSTLVPRRLEGGAQLAVRAAPGRRAEVLKAVEEALWKRSTGRVVEGVRTFTDMRDEQYRNASALVVVMLTITLCLLAVTALGIVGQASFWVTQRTRQIGVRRALGATRGQIVRYFQTENALITCSGIVIGAVLAYVVNYALANQLGADRLPWFYLPIGALVVFALGQIAVFAPARRAASVPPAVATRSA